MGTAGIGLASSSAIAVGALNALSAYKGDSMSAEKMAALACEIEINKLKNPIGKQDQYAVAYGGFNHYIFNSDDTVFVDPLIFKSQTRLVLEEHLMLFYLNIEENLIAEKRIFNFFRKTKGSLLRRAIRKMKRLIWGNNK